MISHKAYERRPIRVRSNRVGSNRVTAALLCLVSNISTGATINANTFSDEFGTGATTCSLREAVQSANNNADAVGCTHVGSYGDDTINLPVGFYTLTRGDFGSFTDIDEDNNALLDIDIRSNLTINGLGTSTNLSIGNTSGDYRGRIFHIISGTVTINDVTIRDGEVPNGRFGGGLRSNPDTTVTLNGVRVVGNEADGGAGGILNAGTMTINDSKIDLNKTNNAVDGGGGIYNAGGTLILNSSIVTGNRTEGNGANGDGAGIYHDSAGPLILNNTSVHSNVIAIGGVISTPVFGNGGGLFAKGGSIEITDSTFSNNIAAGNNAQGGGIRCIQGTSLAITRSLIAFNEAKENPDLSEDGLRGGGISNLCDSLTITDSIISNNIVDNGIDRNIPERFARGGGIYAESDTLIVRSLVIGNSSSQDGGGMEVRPEGEDDLRIVNSTISDNAAGQEGGGLMYSRGFIVGGKSSDFLLLSSSVLNNRANTGHYPASKAGGASMQILGGAQSGKIANSVIAGNVLEDLPAEGECDSSLISLGNNLFQDGTGCDPQDFDPSDRFGQPAGLAAATNNGGLLIGSILGIRAGMLTRAPLPTSVLVDAGNPLGCRDVNSPSTFLATDQIGINRALDGNNDGNARCDIGAIEFTFNLFTNSFE
jgi:CSLREA domain-containing protein